MWSAATHPRLEVENHQTGVIESKACDLLSQFFDTCKQDLLHNAKALWKDQNADILVQDGKSSLFKRMFFARLPRNSMGPSLFQEIQLETEDVLHQDGSVLWHTACLMVFQAKPVFDKFLKDLMNLTTITSCNGDCGDYLLQMKQILHFVG